MFFYLKLIMGVIALLFSTWVVAEPAQLIESISPPNLTPYENLKVVSGNKAGDFYILARNETPIHNTDKKIILPKSIFVAKNSRIVLKSHQPRIAKASVKKIKMMLEKKMLASSKNIRSRKLHHNAHYASRKPRKHIAVLTKKHHRVAFAKKIKHSSRQYLAMQ